MLCQLLISPQTDAGFSCGLSVSTKHKRGREQVLYDELRERVPTGQIVNGQAVVVARLQIADCCPTLIATISQAPREEKNSEEIAEFLGDDSLQSSGTDYTRCSMPPPRKSPEEAQAERLARRHAARQGVGGWQAEGCG